MKQLVVLKNRTNRVPVSLGYNASGEVYTSQIRVAEDPTSALIATWSVAFLTDGTDGELMLTLDNSLTNVTQSKGYMDIKRISGGEPLAVFDEVIEVLFRETVTV